jgi:2-amino-4-hydroxy-6-hydroxymethyldihydropteridine diphosphokinase
MIVIALGSNIGNRDEMLSHARAALEAHGVEIRRISSTIETPALLPADAPRDWDMPFLNQVIVVQTAFTPHNLLMLMKSIESELGRKDRGHWGPREIDLDLIDFHGEIIVSDALTLPHPRMDERRFVLKPLAEIAPDWKHPVFEMSAEEILARIPA